MQAENFPSVSHADRKNLEQALMSKISAEISLLNKNIFRIRLFENEEKFDLVGHVGQTNKAKYFL